MEVKKVVNLSVLRNQTLETILCINTILRKAHCATLIKYVDTIKIKNFLLS